MAGPFAKMTMPDGKEYTFLVFYQADTSPRLLSGSLSISCDFGVSYVKRVRLNVMELKLYRFRNVALTGLVKSTPRLLLLAAPKPQTIIDAVRGQSHSHVSIYMFRQSTFRAVSDNLGTM